MIELNGVVSLISERGLRLIRTADSLRVVGDCPPELAEAIRQHSAALIPFAAIDPDSAEQVAEQQAEANSNDIREQLEAFAEWIVEHHGWASCYYAHGHIDGQLVPATDSQQPARVAETIARLKIELDAIDWASRLFPVTMEVEAKHATKNPNFQGNTSFDFGANA